MASSRRGERGVQRLRGTQRRSRGVDALRAGAETDWLAMRSARSAEAFTEQREEQEAVRSTLRRLGGRQAALLVLRHTGLSYREVARVLGVAPGSVGTLLARAEKAFLRAYERARPPVAGSDGAQGG
ncbi:MAG: sigma factor-like helix-turn-helix DNA-binding protein [Anaerolineae bacterium]